MDNYIEDEASFNRHVNIWKISRFLAKFYIKNKPAGASQTLYYTN